MGRIFETRKSTMFARYDRMAKAFSRVNKQITIAVAAGGPLPENNPSLRRVIQNARAVNMPMDKVEAAIKRSAGEGAEVFDELYYEGYAPHGIALLVETATNNPTRTIASIRHHFKKGDGSLGTTGTVGYLFNRMGVFRLKPEGIDQDELELDLIDDGLEELGEATDDDGNDQLVIRCAFNDFGTMQSALEARGIEPVSSSSEFVPVTMTELTDKEAEDVMKLVALLEGDDDVQTVFHNLV
ncbi:MAG: YebC/PmpR family DNA-binding regulatory protein [Bradymonadia bacterium]|jgi:YebC/PmpR family DNA-binding regulatory protein